MEIVSIRPDTVRTILITLAIGLLTACGGSDTSSPASQMPIPIDDGDGDGDPNPGSDRKPNPSGIFHSAGFIGNNLNNTTLIRNNINLLSFIEGTLVRVSWDAIHTGEGIFDFSAIDEEFEQAEALDTQISLMILDSLETPPFILAECDTFTYIFREEFEHTTCLPWDEDYQRYKKDLLDELGERYDSNPALAMIYITYAAMSNGAEMHWRVDETDYENAGYTEEKLIESYQDVTNLYIDAFPTTPVTMEVHEVFGSAALAEQGYAHCYDQIGSSCGVAIWWCAERLTETSEELVWPVAQQASEQSFSVCQTVGNFTEEPERFQRKDDEERTSAEAMESEFEFFLSENFHVWELWTADIENDSLRNQISDLHESLSTEQD